MKSLHIRKRRLLERKIPVDTAMNMKMLREIGMSSAINEAIIWDQERWKIAPGDMAELMVLAAMSALRVPLYQLADHLKDIDLSYFYDGTVAAEDVNQYNRARCWSVWDRHSRRSYTKK